MFIYKTSSFEEILRYKSKIIMRSDLQDEATIFSTYAATLAVRSFKVIIALAVKFNFKVKQFDVVNAFINALRDLKGVLITYYLLNGYKQKGMLINVDKTFYGLRDSPAL